MMMRRTVKQIDTGDILLARWPILVVSPTSMTIPRHWYKGALLLGTILTSSIPASSTKDIAI
jgi:hypothetical protein